MGSRLARFRRQRRERGKLRKVNSRHYEFEPQSQVDTEKLLQVAGYKFQVALFIFHYSLFNLVKLRGPARCQAEPVEAYQQRYKPRATLRQAQGIIHYSLFIIHYSFLPNP
jgi:hypothetical protein